MEPSDLSPYLEDEEAYAAREFSLGREMAAYLETLTQRASGSLGFRTGAGRIYRDLLIHWPALLDWEDEAQELCQRIASAVFPLTGALYAQAVEITATISWTALSPPTQVTSMATYVTFDAISNTEKHSFLSPGRKLPEDATGIQRGVAVLCKPLNYRYHTIRDKRQRSGHPHAGIFELSERLILELLAKPDFVPREKRILTQTKIDIGALPKLIVESERKRDSSLRYSKENSEPSALPSIATTNGLSALPASLRALEHRLIAYATDKTLAEEIRFNMRKIAQSLRSVYPQALIDDAARLQNQPVAFGPSSAQPDRPGLDKVAPAKTELAPEIPRVLQREQRVAQSQDVQHPVPLHAPAPLAEAVLELRPPNGSIPLSVRPSVLQASPNQNFQNETKLSPSAPFPSDLAHAPEPESLSNVLQNAALAPQPKALSNVLQNLERAPDRSPHLKSLLDSPSGARPFPVKDLPGPQLIPSATSPVQPPQAPLARNEDEHRKRLYDAWDSSSPEPTQAPSTKPPDVTSPEERAVVEDEQQESPPVGVAPKPAHLTFLDLGKSTPLPHFFASHYRLIELDQKLVGLKGLDHSFIANKSLPPLTANQAAPFDKPVEIQKPPSKTLKMSPRMHLNFLNLAHEATALLTASAHRLKHSSLLVRSRDPGLNVKSLTKAKFQPANSARPVLKRQETDPTLRSNRQSESARLAPRHWAMIDGPAPVHPARFFPSKSGK